MVLAGAAGAARELLGTPIAPGPKGRLGRALALARERLGEAAESAWARGRAMTYDEVVAEALRDA